VILYLAHHGDAVDAVVDPQRPLSSAGREHVERLARLAAARGVTPDAVWHSGKLRAKQTAEVFWRACNPLAELKVVRGLQPTDPAEWLHDLVAGDPRAILCVGHFPNLQRVLTRLLTGRDDPPADFPPHGLVALERSDGLFEERWRLSG
jgi:phosphohistidine phosphatase